MLMFYSVTCMAPWRRWTLRVLKWKFLIAYLHGQTVGILFAVSLGIMWLYFCCCRSVEDESAEYHFCESRQLNMSTLRMTSEAKVRVLLLHHSCTVIPHLCTVPPKTLAHSTSRKFL